MSKTVFITGASRGIGYETALLFAKNGYDIGFTYLNSYENANLLKSQIEVLGQKCSIYKYDISNYDEGKIAIDDFVKNNKKIDCLVCNAGIAPYGPLNDMNIDDIKLAFETNVYGMINTCKIVMDYMIEQKKGSIVNLSSIWGITGSSCETIYSATKGAIISFSKALAKELGPSNIRVNIVAPGVVMTDMMKDFNEEDIEILKEKSALNKVSSADEIAQSILFLCSENSKSYTGQVLSPNCGILI